MVLARGWHACALARRLGQAGRNLLRVIDGQYYLVVFAVGQVDDNSGVVAVANGERDALVLMEAPNPDARELRACPLQATHFGNAVRYGPHATDRASGECLISVRRLESLATRHVDRNHVAGNQQVRHEMAFWRIPAVAARVRPLHLSVGRVQGDVHDPRWRFRERSLP